MLMGGYQYYAWELDEWIGLSDLVDDAGFALLLPDGTEDEDGWPFWNATDTCCDYFDSGVDDAGNLTDLLDEAVRRVAVDPARIYLVGHSNGGFMAYRMACDATDRVAAVVSIAGSGYLDASRCHATGPVSVLQVHGTEDDVMPFEGDDEAPGALEMLRRWAVRADCTPDSLTEVTDDLDVVDGHLTSWQHYTGCAPGVDVALWRIRGADHYPDFWYPDFVAAVLEWLAVGE